MARSSRRTAGRARVDRHGRGPRSSVTGPYLPALSTRSELFEATIASAAEYLRELWPDELGDVRFEVAGLPGEVRGDRLDRWRVLAAERRIVFYRVPIERIARLQRADELHRRMLVEGSVFRAVAELLGRDPWDLAPDRYRHP